MSEEDGWRGFLKLCLKGKTIQELEELFDLFLTAEEHEDLSTRYLIVKELIREKMTQREMAKNLGVSIAKITRGSNSMKRISKNLRELLVTHLTQKRS